MLLRLLQLLLAFLDPCLWAMLLPRLAILLWQLQLLLALLAPRLWAMLLRVLPVWPVPIVPTPIRHGQQPVHAKPSRCPLGLSPLLSRKP